MFEQTLGRLLESIKHGRSVTVSRPPCRPFAGVVLILLLWPLARVGSAAEDKPVGTTDDWPMWRHDPSRTAATPHELPAQMTLHWERQLPTPRPAFPYDERQRFDRSYEPVAAGGLLFVPSMVTDSVTALDVETGREVWRFFTGGPVRFAPLVTGGRVYFVSDDGFLYCLNAADGTLHWRFRGAPADRGDRRVLGHGRLVSLWPAQGAPVTKGETIYFAAGIFPNEGTFVHAVHAETGKATWSNTKVSSIPKSHYDHNACAVAGLTPQGYLALVGRWLVVPCGRQLPAFLDPATGKLHRYTTGWGSKTGQPRGAWFVAGVDNYLTHGGEFYDLSGKTPIRAPVKKPRNRHQRVIPLHHPGGFNARILAHPGAHIIDYSFCKPILTPETLFWDYRGELVAYDLGTANTKKLGEHWRMPMEHEVHIKAGDRLYAGRSGEVVAIEVKAKGTPSIGWRAAIKGIPHSMLAAGKRLFVVTREGTILAFGAPRNQAAIRHALNSGPAEEVRKDKWTQRAVEVLAAADSKSGYALVLGIENGRLIEELARNTQLHIIAVDKEEAKVAALRKRFQATGLYGSRVAALLGDPLTLALPPCMSDLVVSETPERLASVPAARVFGLLRPYGGTACFRGVTAERIKAAAKDKALAGQAKFESKGPLSLLRRAGPLPGAAYLSHDGADAANSGASQDELRPPLTVQWYSALRDFKPPGYLHTRVAGGRMLMLTAAAADDRDLSGAAGVGKGSGKSYPWEPPVGQLRALDVFTGRLLWERNVLPLLLGEGAKPPRYFTRRVCFVALPDALYVAYGSHCLVLDAATGEKVRHVRRPEGLERWGELRISGDTLVTVSGQRVLALNRQTDALLWKAEMARPQLSIAVGNGRAFIAEVAMGLRGEDARQGNGSTQARDLATGKVLWRIKGGSQLRYGAKADVVLNALGVLRAKDGKPLLEQRFIVNRCSFHQKHMELGYLAGNRLLFSNNRISSDGRPISLTVVELPSGKTTKLALWQTRGCTYPLVSRHMIVSRFEGNAGFKALETQKTTRFLGLRAGCMSNTGLFIADGVLTAPNNTGGCKCNYNLFAMGFVPARLLD